MAPIPPVSAARSVSARMRSLSWTAKLRRRGRADNSGDAAAGAGTTVGLRPPFAPSPAAASICLGSMGMTDDPSAPPSLNSRGKMSHLHWHGGDCVKTRLPVRLAQYRCVLERYGESTFRPAGPGRIKVAERRSGGEFSHSLL